LALRDLKFQPRRPHFASIAGGPVTRYEIPNVGALNFVLEARSAEGSLAR
jgi:hypothetical protein